MEKDNRLPTGEWNGYYIEPSNPRRGWMHLYMSFEDGHIKGEGTDYVGAWTAKGTYDLDSGACQWVKHYVGKHTVSYRGVCGDTGITGKWTIFSSGEFHIWPKSMTNLNELYLTEEMQQPMQTPTMPLGTVEDESMSPFI